MQRTIVAMWCAGVLTAAVFAGTSLADDGPRPDPDSRGRSAAVALNYCRASFHRIRRYQSKRVLFEEQEKILNNLNLNGIGDEEVIKLYSAVLDEISRVQIADREIAALQDKFKKGLYRQVGATLFVMSTQMALASLEGAVRTGVNSWLDYRDLNWTREFDIWKVDKDRMQAVVEKSTHFLDTFWKLAQKKNIPDRWLVRGDDLDALEEAVREPDAEKRLRMLRRMEPFMECYPPYWYFVGRALQARGQFAEAAETYNKLADLAHGHFRKDDMLAAALANRALIQEFIQQPGSEKTAREALAYSSAVWEANLMCAQVLEKHGRIQDAEDAILRNLDIELETNHSASALIGLYCRTERFDALAQLLATDSFLKLLPVISILQCAEKLGPERIPQAALARLRDSLSATVEARFGMDDVVMTGDATWQLPTARVRFGTVDGLAQTSEFGAATPQANGDAVLRFKGAIEAGHLLNASPTALHGAMLAIHYAAQPTDAPSIVVVLGPPVPKKGKPPAWGPNASPVELRYGTLQLTLAPDSAAPLASSKSSDPTASTPASEQRDPRIPRARILDVIPLPPNAAAVESQTVPPPPPE